MLANLAICMALGAAAAPASMASARVTPSTDSVPENLLRIEVLFDRPLRSSLDMRFVNLFDGSGRRIDGALFDIALPGADERSVAILLHPGRIKRGVGPNLALGPALRQGDRVALRIDDPGFHAPISKTWRIGAAIRTPVSPSQWRLNVPAAGSRQALSVVLPSPLSGSAVQLIAVAAGSGKRLAGTARLDAGETEWRFVPSSNWKPGAYELRVHSSIEDPQGNRVCSAFEQARQSAQPCDRTASIEFRIARPAPRN